MNQPLLVQTEATVLSVALVMNVADRRGVELARALAEAGIGVAIHFLARRPAIVALVAEIWDRGGRVCALDGRDAALADRETLLGEVRLSLGDVQMVVDASRRPASRQAYPQDKVRKQRRAKADSILHTGFRAIRRKSSLDRRAWS